MNATNYFADYSSPISYSKNETILKVENLGVKYGDKVILNNINFEIKNIIRPSITQGQIISIVGKSGCGKCVSPETKITIRNKKTQEIKELTIKEFISLLKP